MVVERNSSENAAWTSGKSGSWLRRKSAYSTEVEKLICSWCTRRTCRPQFAAQTLLHSFFRVLRQLSCSRLSSLEYKEPIQRYQWENLGQMLHLDIKKLGKIGGVEHRNAGQGKFIADGQDGNTCLFAWMMHPELRTPSSFQMKQPNRR